MQFDSQRAFPYPVWRPDVNDYLDGEFQVSLAFSHNRETADISLEAHIALSVDEIKTAVDSGHAKYALVVSCRDTYFRKTVTSSSNEIKANFHAGDLRGYVQVLPFIVSEKTIRGFKSPLINPEFGPGPFEYEKGAVLAIDEPQGIYVDRDLFRPITSLFELVKKDSIQGPEWQVNFSNDRVQIAVSPEMKAKIDTFRNSSKNRVILVNSIYFAAVMQCIRHIKDGQFGEFRWAMVMRQQCENMHLSLDLDEYVLAQRLMRNPLSLMDVYLFRDVAT